MISLFFDANIWIDYCWNKYFGNQRLRIGRKKNTIPIGRINSLKAKIVVTTPLLHEITSHFKDYFILQKATKHGWSAFEFGRVKRLYPLTVIDRREVEKIYNGTLSLPTTKDQYLVNWLDEQTLDEVYKLTNRYGIEFMDCLHFVAALKAQCDIFVTKDEGLLDGVIQASRRFRSFRKMTMMRPAEFISRYRTGTSRVFKR